MARWGVGGAPARVRFTVSWEHRSWARRVARIFAEPSGALAARQKNRRSRLNLRQWWLGDWQMDSRGIGALRAGATGAEGCA
jgi:hypothetical protein